MIIDKLVDKMIEKQAPIIVGLDPTLALIPEYLKKQVFNEKGKNPIALANIFFMFNKAIIDAVHDLVPAVKLQIAMYEQLGAIGIGCYTKTCDYAKEKGLIVVGDIKRGDISSTATAYSNAHLGSIDIEGESVSTFNQDMVTVNPYMGFDSVEPFLADCKKYNKGIFVLIKTSNPSSGQIQDLVTEGKPLFEHVARLVSGWGRDHIGKYGYSSVGAVVGCTYVAEAKRLLDIMPNTFFLLPGYGAQGASGKDLKTLFDTDSYGAIVNSSRGIMGAFKDEKYKAKFGEKDFAQASRQAVLDMKADLAI